MPRGIVKWVLYIRTRAHAAGKVVSGVIRGILVRGLFGGPYVPGKRYDTRKGRSIGPTYWIQYPDHGQGWLWIRPKHFGQRILHWSGQPGESTRPLKKGAGQSVLSIGIGTQASGKVVS